MIRGLDGTRAFILSQDSAEARAGLLSYFADEHGHQPEPGSEDIEPDAGGRMESDELVLDLKHSSSELQREVNISRQEERDKFSLAKEYDVCSAVARS